MDQDALKLVIGVMALLVIVNTTLVYSGALAGADNSTVNITAGKPGTVNITVNTTKPTPTPTKAPTKKPTPTPTPKTYIEIIHATPEPRSTYTHIVPVIPTRSEVGFDTIYTIKNQSVTELMPRVVVDAVNPPVIVDFVFTPLSITDLKPLDYKIIKTEYHENRTIDRPYENSWFLLNVTDMDDGSLITQEGVGKYYGMQYEKQIVIPNSGKIAFDLDGKYGNITLSIKMQKPK